MQDLAASAPDWDCAQQHGADHQTCPVGTTVIPPGACPVRQSLVVAHNKIVRLRDGIAARMGLCLKDVERIRTLGIDPLSRYRVFEVDRTTDEILAIWSSHDGVLGPPHWSEIAAYLDRLAGLVEQALSDHDGLRGLPQGQDLRVLMRDAGLMRFADRALAP